MQHPVETGKRLCNESPNIQQMISVDTKAVNIIGMSQKHQRSPMRCRHHKYTSMYGTTCTLSLRTLKLPTVQQRTALRGHESASGPQGSYQGWRRDAGLLPASIQTPGTSLLPSLSEKPEFLDAKHRKSFYTHIVLTCYSNEMLH